MRVMEVANPIYDAVFKYLLEDERVARLLIGQIAGLEVQSLVVSPQEAVAPRPGGVAPDAPPSLTLFRMDFAARVRGADGRARQVLIEIQKAKAPTVVERFRLYLGQQYASRDNIVSDGRGGSEAVPLVTIYLLGYDLGLSQEAVLDVCPQVTERRTGRVLDAGHPFVEGIHHRSHIVQIPRLSRGGEDELSRFLTIFDQGRAVAGRGNHVLGIEEGEYPARWGFVLRQLQRAMAEEEVRRYMDGEDLLLKDSILLAQRAEHERQRAEHERQRAERERREKEELLARAARQLHGLGRSVEEIARTLSVDPEELRRVLSVRAPGRE